MKAHFRHAYTRADGRHFSATNVTAHCSGNPPSFSFWNPKLKNTPPANWPIKDEVQKNWTAEEIERILEAVGFLPSEMSRDDIRQLTRMAKSILFPNPASADHNGNIVFYDNSFDDQHNLAQILAHEIAHRIYDSLSDDDRQSYRFAGGWVDLNVGKGSPDYVLTRTGMVDPDSANSIEEDFSNNVEFFLFNPLKLKDVSPGPYNWISKHFGGNFKLGKGLP